MLCPKCGAQVAEGSDFCQKCGTKLTAVSQARQPDNTPVNGPKKKKSKKATSHPCRNSAAHCGAPYC